MLQSTVLQAERRYNRSFCHPSTTSQQLLVRSISGEGNQVVHTWITSFAADTLFTRRNIRNALLVIVKYAVYVSYAILELLQSSKTISAGLLAHKFHVLKRLDEVIFGLF